MIALIVSPLVIGNIRKSEKASFERSINGLIESVRIDYSEDSFLAPREYFYEKKDLTLLTVDEIMRDEKVLINGKIDGNGFLYVDGDGIIHIENICNKNYCASGPEGNIEIKPNEDGKIPDHSKSEPMIKLNGEATIYLGLEEPYTELGAIAKTKLGEKLEYKIEIRKNEQVVESIDTSHEATYKIIYTTSSNGKTVSVTRTVVIVDMTPVITMTEPEVNYVKEQEILINVSAIKPNKVEGFTYQINEEDPIEVRGLNKVIVLNQTGEIKVKVTVTDDHGHRNELSKTYRIDQTGPVITFEDVTIKVTEVTGYDLMTGVTATDNSGNAPTVTYTGGLSAVVGNQTITYTAIDEAGNETVRVRTFTVVEADGPILNFSNAGSNVWTKAQTITVTAIDNSNLSSFTYEVFKDNVSQGVKDGTISGKNGTANIPLNSSGIYQIKLKGSDQYGNSSAINSGTYQIDVEQPKIVASSTSTTIEVGTNSLVPGNYYSIASSMTHSGTTTNCIDLSDGNKAIENTNSLSVGNHAIKCTVTRGNGETANITRTFQVTEAYNPGCTLGTKLIAGKSVQGCFKTDTSGNVRYSGINPNNYVCFGTDATTCSGKQLWRIIGVVDGNIKLISSTWYDNGTGNPYDLLASNNWAKPSSLNTQLHDNVYNNSEWISSPTQKGWILHNKWKLGGVGTWSTAGDFEQAEKESGYIASNYIGMMTMTDFRYGSTAELCTSGTYLPVKDNPCFENNWLLHKQNELWTITPVAGTSTKVWGLMLPSKYATDLYADRTSPYVKPVVILDTNVRIKSGNGTKENPYLLMGPQRMSEIMTNEKVGKNGLIKVDISGNKRYAGENPNNYVCFGTDATTCSGKQLWRIIGEIDGNLKLISTVYYGGGTGQIYDDTNNNNWARPSSLNILLHNNVYNNREWINSSTQKGWILHNRWKLGGVSSTDLLGEFENAEIAGGYTTSNYVGMMTMTDFGYASSYHLCSKSSHLMVADNPCFESNWLKHTIYNEWTITPVAGEEALVWAKKLPDAKSAKIHASLEGPFVRPVVILKPGIEVISGDGTTENPYILIERN